MRINEYNDGGARANLAGFMEQLQKGNLFTGEDPDAEQAMTNLAFEGYEADVPMVYADPGEGPLAVSEVSHPRLNVPIRNWVFKASTIVIPISDGEELVMPSVVVQAAYDHPAVTGRSAYWTWAVVPMSELAEDADAALWLSYLRATIAAARRGDGTQEVDSEETLPEQSFAAARLLG